MGRHRSTLRELGWGVSNSPNPWKQGSAKRVVRTLDYSQAEVVDESSSAAQSINPNPMDEKANQLQQDAGARKRPSTPAALLQVAGSVGLARPMLPPLGDTLRFPPCF